MKSDSETSGPTATTIPAAPSRQKNLSRNIIPDYIFYSLAFSPDLTAVQCGFAEVKKKIHFNDNAVCQTIGYYMARRSGTRRDVDVDVSQGKEFRDLTNAWSLLSARVHNNKSATAIIPPSGQYAIDQSVVNSSSCMLLSVKL